MCQGAPHILDPPPNSPAMPKPLYENQSANRIDAKIVDKNAKKVIVIEMSCPWLENRQLKDLEKTQNNQGPALSMGAEEEIPWATK